MADIKSLEKWKVQKNLLQLCFGFFFVLSVYNGIEPLQSSLNPDKGLGTTTTGIIYATAVISSLFLAAPVINIVGPKRGLLCLFLAHTLYCIANFHPRWWTLVPASALVGLTATIGWGSQGIYMMSLARRYGQLTNQTTDAVMSLFTGIFFIFIGLTRPLGNVISSVVFKEVIHKKPVFSADNTTFSFENTSVNNYVYSIPNLSNETFQAKTINQSEYTDVNVCGANHCPYIRSHRTMLLKPDVTLIYILMGAYLCCNLTGVLITAFLPNITDKQDTNTDNQKQSSQKKSKEVLRLFRNPLLLLLILPYLASGMVRAMNVGSFTQSFVSCSLGTGMVGYAMMCDGFGYAFTAFISGRLTKYVPRVFHVVFASLTNIGLAVVWLTWQPSMNMAWLFFLLATIQGGTNAIWKVQTMAQTGVTFSTTIEAGYAHLMIWECLGHVLVFGYNSHLCFYVKAYIFVCVVFLALVSFVSFHVYTQHLDKNSTNIKSHEENELEECEMQRASFLKNVE